MLGVLTTGDVDLQVRIERDAFATARDLLCKLYEPLYQEEAVTRSARAAVSSSPIAAARIEGKRDLGSASAALLAEVRTWSVHRG